MRRLKLGPAAVLVTSLLLQPFHAARAEEVSLGAPPEISHLLDYIARSECVFIRHGMGYGGGIAAEYIRRKYADQRDEIRDGEEFIARVATVSEEGKPYRVRCPGQVSVAAAAWLRTELRAFLSQATAD